MRRFGFALSLLGALAISAVTGRAAGISEAYLFSTFTTSVGLPATPPFDVTSVDGVQLFLDGSGVATGQADIGAVGPVEIQFALTYATHTGTINSGEVDGSTAAHVNSEVGTWDDVGVVNEGAVDAPLNVDYGDGAAVTFSLVSGVPCLVVAEDAGLDPFKLEYSALGDFSDALVLFNGFDDPTETAIRARDDFGGDDLDNEAGDDIDQVYVFFFDEPLTGAFRITETDNLNSSSEKLEVDFVGACIPEPTAFVLVGMGLGLAGTLLRRRS